MEYEKLKMWSYRIVHDKQFAPNPFKGVLTLATCKPLIRRSNESRPGVWIAGFAAYSVKYGVQPKKGRELLIYLAKISEVMTMQDYWTKYPQKRAQKCGEEFEEYYGDNIYDENLHLINDNHHKDWDFRRDMSGKNVLICDEFYYFAPDSRLVVPKEFDDLVLGYNVNLGRSKHNEKSIGIISYKDKLNMCISSKLYETETERDIFKMLTKLSIPVTIYSNRRDLYGTK